MLHQNTVFSPRLVTEIRGENPHSGAEEFGTHPFPFRHCVSGRENHFETAGKKGKERPNSMSIYQAELRVPQHLTSFLATQRFITGACESLGVAEKIRLDVELAVEEGLLQLFASAKPGEMGEDVRVRVVFDFDALHITVLAPGRPFDFHRLPTFRPEDVASGILEGLGTFLIRRLMDSIQWRYVEKEGQELTMTKHLPSPIADTESACFVATSSAPVPVGALSYRTVRTEEDAFAVAACAFDIYRYAYKDVIYYPLELLAWNLSGQMHSWIAVDEAGTVFGHYAIIRKHPGDSTAEMGAAFVRPECRGGGVFQALSRCAHDDAARCGLSSLYSLSVTNHVATQKISEREGRRTVGLRLASSPAVFVEGATPGERVTTALNYKQCIPRTPRTLFLPERYREMILTSYGWLGMSPLEGLSGTAEPGEDLVTTTRDLTWNRAVLGARGGATARHKMAAYTELLLEQGVACAVLSIDLEDPGAPLLTEEAARLGFVYSGIFPESTKDGHDALQMQLLNGITLDEAKILLHQDSAKAILAFVKSEAPRLFTETKK
jgi:anti-sigma regulatory factor (Ser/Thr protein kinase)